VAARAWALYSACEGFPAASRVLHRDGIMALLRMVHRMHHYSFQTRREDSHEKANIGHGVAGSQRKLVALAMAAKNYVQRNINGDGNGRPGRSKAGESLIASALLLSGTISEQTRHGIIMLGRNSMALHMDNGAKAELIGRHQLADAGDNRMACAGKSAFAKATDSADRDAGKWRGSGGSSKNIGG